MAFTTVPAPLYVLYQARDHFGAAMVTVIFAAYAADVVASLLLAGHVSDWLGRRRIVAAAVGINMAAGLIFLAWPTVTGLLAGRLVSGISAGLITATATAFLAELHSSSRPGAPSARAELVSTAANLGGLGFGALLAGFLAEHTTAPLWLPYLVTEVLMLAGAIALAGAPETVTRPDPRPRYRPQRVRGRRHLQDVHHDRTDNRPGRRQGRDPGRAVRGRLPRADGPGRGPGHRHPADHDQGRDPRVRRRPDRRGRRGQPPARLNASFDLHRYVSPRSPIARLAGVSCGDTGRETSCFPGG